MDSHVQEQYTITPRRGHELSITYERKEVQDIESLREERVRFAGAASYFGLDYTLIRQKTDEDVYYFRERDGLIERINIPQWSDDLSAAFQTLPSQVKRALAA